MVRKLMSTFVVLPIGLLLVVFAVVNRHAVTVSLDPFGDSTALNVTMPLFLLILTLLGLGVLIGGLATWLSQGRWRREAHRLDLETRRLREEREALRSELASRTRALPPPAAA